MAIWSANRVFLVFCEICLVASAVLVPEDAICDKSLSWFDASALSAIIANSGATISSRAVLKSKAISE